MNYKNRVREYEEKVVPLTAEDRKRINNVFKLFGKFHDFKDDPLLPRGKEIGNDLLNAYYYESDWQNYSPVYFTSNLSPYHIGELEHDLRELEKYGIYQCDLSDDEIFDEEACMNYYGDYARAFKFEKVELNESRKLRHHSRLTESSKLSDKDIKRDLRDISEYFLKGLYSGKNAFSMDYNEEEPDFAVAYGYYSGQAGALNFCGREIAKIIYDNVEPTIDWDYYIDIIRNHSEDYEENWED